MTDVRDIQDAPWDLRWWHGARKSLDGTGTELFTEADVDAVLYHGNTGEDLDGEEAAIIRLKDGRLVGWTTWWGPTGSGFCDDAYGGDADIYFARDEELLIRFALTDEGRRLCGLPGDVE